MKQSENDILLLSFTHVVLSNTAPSLTVSLFAISLFKTSRVLKTTFIYFFMLNSQNHIFTTGTGTRNLIL